MPLILPGNVGSATAATGYDVANSIRFNRADSAHMTRSAAGSSATKSTFSFWVKRTLISAGGDFTQVIHNFYSAADSYNKLYFDGNDQIIMKQQVSSSTQIQIMPTRKFRDISAWTHIAYIVDPTESTEANRVKVFVNGTQETSFGTETYPAQDTAVRVEYAQYFGRESGSDSKFFDGYLAEFVFLDGVAAAISDLGEFDSDSPTIWKPKDVSGLTFGARGFYLDFEDSGDLGDDESGNGNDFTEVNLAATDQMIDTCTKNFPIQNSIAGTSSSVGANTYTEGNLQVLTPQSENGNNFSTIGVSSGKWYGEFYIKANSGIERSLVGVSGDVMATLLAENNMGSLSGARDVGYMGNDGDKFVSGTESSYGGSAFSNGDVIGVALDLDNRTVNFAQNNSFKGTISIASTGIWHMGCGDVSAGARATIVANYGQDSSFAGSITAANNTDEHSEGLFKYSPPSGFITLNSTNLAEYG